MSEEARDNGTDKTDAAEDRRLAAKALEAQRKMPFYESEPPVYYAPHGEKEKE
jgi:hypothetical protein